MLFFLFLRVIIYLEDNFYFKIFRSANIGEGNKYIKVSKIDLWFVIIYEYE
jgi:hypothetical protein